MLTQEYPEAGPTQEAGGQTKGEKAGGLPLGIFHRAVATCILPDLSEQCRGPHGDEGGPDLCTLAMGPAVI